MSETPINEEISYTIAALARATGISRSQLYLEIAAKRLIARKVGRRTIVVRQEAESWLASLPIFDHSGRTE